MNLEDLLHAQKYSFPALDRYRFVGGKLEIVFIRNPGFAEDHFLLTEEDALEYFATMHPSRVHHLLASTGMEADESGAVKQPEIRMRVRFPGCELAALLCPEHYHEVQRNVEFICAEKAKACLICIKQNLLDVKWHKTIEKYIDPYLGGL